MLTETGEDSKQIILAFNREFSSFSWSGSPLAQEIACGLIAHIRQSARSALLLAENYQPGEEPTVHNAISAIVRAVVEACGLFVVIFLETKDLDEQDFILQQMKIRGLLVRKDSIFPAMSASTEARRNQENSEVDRMIQSIQYHPYYIKIITDLETQISALEKNVKTQSQNLKQQSEKEISKIRKDLKEFKSNARKGRVELTNSSSLPKRLGFGSVQLSHLYQFLCDFVHGGYLALRYAHQPSNPNILANSSLLPASQSLVLLVDAMKTHQLCHVHTSKVFQDPKISRSARIMLKMAKTEPKDFENQ